MIACFVRLQITCIGWGLAQYVTVYDHQCDTLYFSVVVENKSNQAAKL